MTYTTVLNDQDYFEENYMVIMSPRRRINSSDFALVSGSTYKASFDFGFISAVSTDDTVLVDAGSTTLASGEYYWDIANSEVYIRMADDGAPIAADFIIATYELYYSTQDFQWHRDPLDENSADTSFDPFLVSAPQTKQTFRDFLQGFTPTTITNLQIDNHEHVLEKHLYDSSFHKVQVVGYHIVDEVNQLNTANIKKVFDGFIDSITYAQSKINFGVADVTKELDGEMRSTVAGFNDFLGTTEFPLIDFSSDGSPKRRVFGIVEQMDLININFTENIIATENNEYLVAKTLDMQGSDAAGVRGVIDFSADVDTVTTGAGLVTTIHFTDADFAQNFSVGEEIIVYPTAHVWADPPDTDYNSFRTEITVVGATSIDIGTARDVIGAGQISARMQVPLVFVQHEDLNYTLHPFRDYYIDVDNDMFKIVLDAGYVASSGMPGPIINFDRVFGNVYGHNTGDSESWAQATTNGARLVKYMLQDLIGVPAARINAASFSSFEASYDEILGFPVPFEVGGSYERFKQVITKVLISIRARLYLDNDNKYTLQRIDKVGVIDDIVVDDDIKLNTLKMNTSYIDLVDTVRVNYRKKDHALDVSQFEGGSLVATSTNNLGRYLHGVTKEMSVDTVHYLESEASSFADFLGYIYGDRINTFSATLSKRFFDSLIGDNVTISREKLPGFEFVEGTLRARDTKIIAVEKGIDSVKLIFDDQKGIEDN